MQYAWGTAVQAVHLEAFRSTAHEAEGRDDDGRPPAALAPFPRRRGRRSRRLRNPAICAASPQLQAVGGRR